MPRPFPTNALSPWEDITSTEINLLKKIHCRTVTQLDVGWQAISPQCFVEVMRACALSLELAAFRVHVGARTSDVIHMPAFLFEMPRLEHLSVEIENVTELPPRFLTMFCMPGLKRLEIKNLNREKCIPWDLSHITWLITSSCASLDCLILANVNKVIKKSVKGSSRLHTFHTRCDNPDEAIWDAPLRREQRNNDLLNLLRAIPSATRLCLPASIPLQPEATNMIATGALIPRVEHFQASFTDPDLMLAMLRRRNGTWTSSSKRPDSRISQFKIVNLTILSRAEAVGGPTKVSPKQVKKVKKLVKRCIKPEGDGQTVVPKSFVCTCKACPGCL
ncbi:hypothetical protein D9613_010741 [Agrocybe pediades]|uniref:Uncharacterized protein n=1 Tax=Agrocybe pediades TaxID=84607 RepID=A0A8H4VKI7_9AGAR|nr:hypothetical protein D9613_010741 [Agrocybe pediades]